MRGEGERAQSLGEVLGETIVLSISSQVSIARMMKATREMNENPKVRIVASPNRHRRRRRQSSLNPMTFSSSRSRKTKKLFSLTFRGAPQPFGELSMNF
jgi:hypothetical protein